jgi:phage protein D
MPGRTAVSPKFKIMVEGTPLEAAVKSQLIEFVVDHRRNAPSLFRLVFHDPQLLLTDNDTFKTAKDVKIEVEVDPQIKGVLVDGQITTMTLEDDAWGTQLIVQGMDRGHGLFRDRVAEVHLNVTYADVVNKIAGRHRLTARVGSTRTVYPYLAQNNLTDWEFLQLMAAELGWDVWVDGRNLHFDKPAEASSGDPVELTRGENLMHLGVVVTGGGQTAKTVETRGWDHVQQRAVVGTASAAQTVGVAGASTAAQARDVFDEGKVVVVGSPFARQAEADAAAKATAEEIASGFVELTGACAGDPRLKSRGVVDIKGAGRRFSGKYVLSEVRHVWETEAGYRTEFTVTGRHDHSLYALAGGHASAALPTPARIEGLVVGIVTDVKDPENLGRIKVKLPWLADNYESDWARVTQVIGGSSYGSLFMPDVNDEVLIGFEHGDIHRPYVLGSLYSGRNKPEKPSDKLVASDGKVATQRLETREHNRLVFFDHKGTKEGVTLRTGDDKYYLDLNKTETKITISSDGGITIEAKKGKVLLEAKDLEIKTTGTLDATATGAATLKSQAKMTIEGGAGLELKSSGVVEIKGSLVKVN